MPCPTGMRKNTAGECIKQRCPNGTRKHKVSHECVGSRVVEPQSRVASLPKRCSKGTRRNKVSGNCDPSHTPRTVYAKRYNKLVTLLGNTTLFQVSFDTPDQFNRYVQITAKPNVECFIQALFSLRLRDLQSAKEDIVRIQPYKHGVLYSEAANYFRALFGLHETQLHYYAREYTPWSKIDTMLTKQLVNNHATIFTIRVQTPTERWGHYMVAYKFNGQLHYYDPQNKQSSTTIEFFNTPVQKIIGYGTFEVNKVVTTVMKKNVDPIPFYGGSMGFMSSAENSRTSDTEL